ncbi:hypothetical protein RINTHM_11190 [Richelia intracellularis HM01]|nr:hypothetical protein RINTHM_11190 [Richelia intracellularis HM01]
MRSEDINMAFLAYENYKIPLKYEITKLNCLDLLKVFITLI